MYKRFFLSLIMAIFLSGVGFAQTTTNPTDSEQRMHVYIPNAFTPNFDGLNDSFKIIADGKVASFELVILNRRGEEVFYSTDINRVWNGSTDNGEYFNSPSVFLYFLKIRGEGEVVTQTYKGHIVMIR